MNCPNCHSEVADNAKFCTKCGTKLTPQNPQQIMPKFCVKCGNPLNDGAKFCTKCGASVAPVAPAAEKAPVPPVPPPAAPKAPVPPVPPPVAPKAPVPPVPPPVAPKAPVPPVPPPAASKAPVPSVAPKTPDFPMSDKVIFPGQEEVYATKCPNCGAEMLSGVKFCTKCGTSLKVTPDSDKAPVPPVPPPVDSASEKAPVPPVPPPMPPKTSENDDSDIEPKKKFPIVIVIVAITVLIVLGCLGFFVVKPLVESKLGKESSSEQVEKVVEETETISEETTEEDHEAEIQAELTELNATVDEAIGQMLEDDYIDGGLLTIEGALDTYIDMTNTYGSRDDINEKAATAFSYYVKGVGKHYDMLFGQDVLPSLYQQMLGELEHTVDLGYKLQDNGIMVDISDIEAKCSQLPAEYTARYISAFNKFTEGENWSRTEAWNLMEGADQAGLVNHDNLDDPMTLRYAFAKAYITRRTYEHALADGSMNKEDVVNEILNTMTDSDFSPLLIYDLEYQYGKRYGIFDEIVGCIQNNEGFKLGKDIDIEHFWYFNDFGETSVDDTNGLSPETREQVRTIVKDMLSANGLDY